MTKKYLELYIFCRYRIMCGRGNKRDEKTVKEIENYIYTVPDIITRQILTERYIFGKTWKDVAASVGTTADSCRMAVNRYLGKNSKR